MALAAVLSGNRIARTIDAQGGTCLYAGRAGFPRLVLKFNTSEPDMGGGD